MSFQISADSYVMPTSAGAYYCITSTQTDSARTILQKLLQQPSVPLLNNELISSWFPQNEQHGLQTLSHMQKLNWLQSCDQQQKVTQGSLEDLLPGMLKNLSSENKVLLADSLGFYLSSSGFPHETAEEISALSADLISLHQRHKGLLQGNLKLPSENWGLLDAAGYSQLGFWPLHIGEEVFSLVVSGMPRFEHTSFLDLVWTLHTRYAS